MKATFLMFVALLLMIAGGFYSCGMNDGNNTMPDGVIAYGQDGTPLSKDSKWKSVGVVDVETGVMTILEPTDCEKCYTLTFETDHTFSTNSSSNDLGGKYIINNSTHNFRVLSFGGTKINEIGNGNLYVTPFWDKSIQSFSLQKNELRLYYNDKKSYILFKSLEL